MGWNNVYFNEEVEKNRKHSSNTLFYLEVLYAVSIYMYLMSVIFPDLHFSAIYHNRQYYQNLVTAKIKCITESRLAFNLLEKMQMYYSMRWMSQNVKTMLMGN